MTIISLEELLSKARLSPYHKLLATDSDKECLAYYFQTLEGAAMMLPLFNLIEVILRNRLDLQIKSMAATGLLPLHGTITPDRWFESVTDGFSRSHSKVVNLGKQSKPPATTDDYIAQLDFGYYVYLLHDRHADATQKYCYIWRPGVLQAVFPGIMARPRSLNGLFGLLRQCEDMRNRLCHHEPMWKGRHSGKHGGYENIRQKFLLLFEVLRYLSPEMADIAISTALTGFSDVKQLFVSQCKDKYSDNLESVKFLS